MKRHIELGLEAEALEICKEPNRKQAVILIVAAILAARKLATVPQNSPAAVAAIADAVSDARRIVERVAQSGPN